MTTQLKIYVADHRGMVASAMRIDQRYFRTNEIETLLDVPPRPKKCPGQASRLVRQSLYE